VNQRIVALGGQAASPAEIAPAVPEVVPEVVTPEPEKARLPKAPVQTKIAQPAPVTAPPPVVAPAPVAPAVAPAIAPPPSGLSAAVRAELNERMINATAKVQSAEQAIGPLQQSLVSRGQSLNSDTQNAMVQMRSRLAKAKAEIAAGDAAAALDDMAATEAFAARVLRTAGR
jgi:hypothetical protein